MRQHRMLAKLKLQLKAVKAAKKVKEEKKERVVKKEKVEKREKVARKEEIHVKTNVVQENVIQQHVDWICLVKIALRNVPLNA